ncbi:hypothetical protein NIES4106_14520 [Fischerella sp. NIES-4106]|nr:hypothetical protein NIES4106_14520 [Fischerella sp. NIES-4106]
MCSFIFNWYNLINATSNTSDRTEVSKHLNDATARLHVALHCLIWSKFYILLFDDTVYTELNKISLKLS